MSVRASNAPGPVPGIEELSAHPERVSELPVEERQRLVPQLAALVVLLTSNTTVPEPPQAAPRPEPRTDILLTVPVAAERMGFKKSYVYELIRRGELRAVRRGRYVRVRASAVDQWVSEHEG